MLTSKILSAMLILTCSPSTQSSPSSADNDFYKKADCSSMADLEMPRETLDEIPAHSDDEAGEYQDSPEELPVDVLLGALPSDVLGDLASAALGTQHESTDIAGMDDLELGMLDLEVQLPRAWHDIDDPERGMLDLEVPVIDEDTNVASQQDGRSSDLVGMILGGKFKIGNLVSCDTYSDVYAATCDMDDDSAPPPHVEARIFPTDGLDEKIKTYRRRSMRRLSKRTLWKEVRGPNVILVYRKGIDETSAGSGNAHSMSSPGGVQDSRSNPLAPPIPRTKNRESARIKQKEKRTKRREALRQGQDGRTNDGPRSEPRQNNNPNLEERTIACLLALEYLQSYRALLFSRDPHPGASRKEGVHEQPDESALPPYLQQDPVKYIEIASATELATLMQVKHGEEAFLGKLQQRLPGIRSRTLQRYLSMCTQTAPDGEASEAWDLKKKRMLETYQALDRVEPFVKELVAKAGDSRWKLGQQLDLVQRKFDIWSGERDVDHGQGSALRKEMLTRFLCVLVPHTLPYGYV